MTVETSEKWTENVHLDGYTVVETLAQKVDLLVGPAVVNGGFCLALIDASNFACESEDVKENICCMSFDRVNFST